MSKYGTLINGIMKPAPRAIQIGCAVVCNPTDAQYEAAGYKRIVDTPPTIDAEHYAVPTGWAEQGGEIVRQYEVREVPPPPPRVFATADVIEALMQAGVWPQVRTFIDSRGMIDMVLATKEFSEDDPNFTGPRDALKEQLGWTDEQVEALLARCVKE